MTVPLFPAWLLLSLLVVSGCSPGQDDPHAPPSEHQARQSSTERDSVLALLRSVKHQTLRDAFDQLPNYRFTRRIRTEQLDRARRPVAFEERVIRHETRDGARTVTEQAADSAGAFTSGLLSRLAPDTEPLRDPQDVIRHILPEDPPYLSPRNRDAYQYEISGDTVLWSRPARVVQVRARPGEGDAQNIRSARLYVDRTTKDLLAFTMEYARRTLLFREQSTISLSLRPAPDGGWVPYNTRFQTRIHVPLSPSRSFRTISTYYDYASDGPPGSMTGPPSERPGEMLSAGANLPAQDDR